MRKNILAVTSVCLFFIATQADAVEKKLNVKHFWQDNGCWCGVATVEMVEQFYNPSWKYYPQRQTNLANPKNNGGVKVGTTSQGTSRSNPCGSDGGVNTSELLTMLNTRLKKNNKRFNSATMKLNGSPKRSTYFHQRVMKSINNGDPFIFAGHTRYADGTKKYLQHWYLIIGYKDADGNSQTISENDGYYIHDATVGAGFKRLKTLGKKGKFVSHFNMVKYIAGYKGNLYPVIQIN